MGGPADMFAAGRPGSSRSGGRVECARAWAHIVDCDWRWVYMTDDTRLSLGSLLGMVPVPLGMHYFGPETGVRD